MLVASIGLFGGFFGPIQVLLAQQAEAIAGADGKKSALAIVLACGAMTSVVTNPLFGAFSDRTRSRLGRRLPWVLGGATAGTVSLLLLGRSGSVVLMAVWWMAAQASLNAMFAALNASVPDQVPVDRRGAIAGVIALGQTLGVVLGTGIASATGSITAGYVATAGVLLVLTLPYALLSRDVPLADDEAPEPFAWGVFVAAFWISPRQHPDFAWAWITRFLVNLSNALGLLYLLYFLQDAVGLDSDAAADTVFLLSALYAGSLVLTAVIAGRLSDRAGRRKVFVTWSGVVTGVSSLALALVQTEAMAYAAALVLGVGFGIYQAVDFALVTQVLPSSEDRAKDLGVINIASALPQVLAPLLAGAVLALVAASGGATETDGRAYSVGYGAVYAVAFVAAIAGSMLVHRIRSVP